MADPEVLAIDPEVLVLEVLFITVIITVRHAQNGARLLQQI